MNRLMLLFGLLLIGVIGLSSRLDQVAAGTQVFAAVADAHVRADTPTTNYNGATVDSDGGPVTIGYFQFNTTGAPAPNRVTLRITVGGGSRSEEHTSELQSLAYL